MSTPLRIVLAQLNLTVGDIAGNLNQLLNAATQARDSLSADVIVFPELSITGYPPEDLLLRPSFIRDADAALESLIKEIQGIYCVVGHTYASVSGLFNACSLIYNGHCLGTYAKQHLPNYGVFDECRYFVPGHDACVVNIKGIPVGLTVCEDLWYEKPVKQAAENGARLILAPNASPFELEKHVSRQTMLASRAMSNNIAIVYVNCVGGQDELVFDGGSMVVGVDGNIAQHAGFFNEALLPVDIEINHAIHISKKSFSLPSTEELAYQALTLGLRDYINKNHFPGVLIGLSGGIDSALVLAIAVDALGKERVTAVIMPSRYTADMSIEDSLQLIQHVGIDHEMISIEPTFNAFLETLKPLFQNKKPDITEENLQSRCRGTLLMALSNKTGRLVLTTGNRSEMAVGYATLYGDMAGGLDVLKDVPKQFVYALARYRNRLKSIIPQRIIDRAPTAELAPDQKDEDSLPPYAVLDKILELYLNKSQSLNDIVAAGFDQATVEKVIRLIHRSEFKRRQSAIGIRINHKAFGRDWRYPITHYFKQ